MGGSGNNVMIRILMRAERETSPDMQDIYRDEELNKPDTVRAATSCAQRWRSSTSAPPTMAPKTDPPAYIL